MCIAFLQRMWDLVYSLGEFTFFAKSQISKLSHLCCSLHYYSLRCKRLSACIRQGP